MEPHNNDNVSKEHVQDPRRLETDDNGKGKAKSSKPGVVDRIRNSGQEMLGAAIGFNQQPPTLDGISQTKQATSGPQGQDRGFGESSTSQTAGRYVRKHTDGAFRSPKQATASNDEFQKFMNGTEHISTPSEQLSNSPMPAASYFSTSDGAELIQLLAEPEKAPTWGTGEDQDDFLSPESAANLREALFGPQSANIPWTSLLNFSPDFAYSEENKANGKAKASAELQMGTGDIGMAKEAWLEQWSTVLSSYTDEVWGDIRPLVAQAKQEAEAISRQGASDDPSATLKAVNRLRQILAHVRGGSPGML